MRAGSFPDTQQEAPVHSVVFLACSCHAIAAAKVSFTAAALITVLMHLGRLVKVRRKERSAAGRLRLPEARVIRD